MTMQIDGPPRINFIPDDLVTPKWIEAIRSKWSGRIGLARIPGWSAGELDADLDLWRATEVSLVVSLIDEVDLMWLNGSVGEDDELFRRMKEAGLKIRRYPILNLDVPQDMESFAELVDELLVRLRKEETIMVHCFAGLGRTGTLGASLLVATGIPCADAIAIVREARPGSLETSGQETFVADYEAYLQSRSPR